MRVVHTVLRILVLLSSSCLGNRAQRATKTQATKTSAAEERKHGIEGQGGIVTYSLPQAGYAPPWNIRPGSAWCCVAGLLLGKPAKLEVG